MTFTLLPIPVLSSVFKSAVTGVTDAMLSAFTAVEPVSAESVLPVVLSETDEDVCLFALRFAGASDDRTVKNTQKNLKNLTAEYESQLDKIGIIVGADER